MSELGTRDNIRDHVTHILRPKNCCFCVLALHFILTPFWHRRPNTLLRYFCPDIINCRMPGSAACYLYRKIQTWDFKCVLNFMSRERKMARESSKTSWTLETPFLERVTQRYCFTAEMNISLDLQPASQSATFVLGPASIKSVCPPARN